MATVAELTQEITGLKSDFVTLATSVETEIQQFLDAQAANDPVALQKAVDDLKALRAQAAAMSSNLGTDDPTAPTEPTNPA